MRLKGMVGMLGWVMGGGFMVWAAWAAQVPYKAEITVMTGMVEWRRGETDTWKAAEANQVLERGDQVRTGDPGEATVTFENGTSIQLSPGTEFTVSALNRDSATQQIESVVTLLKGRVRAEVTPLPQGSTFEIETPVMVAAVRGTTLSVGIGPDGSITATTDKGNVELIREGENNFIAKMDSGDEALIEYDPESKTIKITSLKGIFDVLGPDGVTRTLSPGDTVVFQGGAATFIPAGDPPSPPSFDSVGEPTDSPASSSLTSSVS